MVCEYLLMDCGDLTQRISFILIVYDGTGYGFTSLHPGCALECIYMYDGLGVILVA